ncbi:polymorphic toxin-type HINT domain-containing protein, partial [Kribbella sp. NPDC048915]|uniref:polymorphic toxin-type HINT domain-containing protein n=1 Tax=Kribbella sp. NPDC048915 TaxID=3155148 RepID=UPI0033E3CE11
TSCSPPKTHSLPTYATPSPRSPDPTVRTKLIRLRQGARWYSPGTGTFNSRDTVSYDAGTASSVLNLYAYAGGNPLTFNDPDGHRAIDPGGGKLKRQCEWRYELVGDGHQWIYRCRWVGADDPVKPPPPTDGDGDGGCKKNCRGPGDGGDDDCKWNCGGPGDGGNGGAGEGGCKRNCGPKPPPKCDPQCQLTKKIKKERDDLEQEAKTIAQPPPGDPVCANGNPLCPTDPSRPATVVTSGGDLTNETANWSTEQYETALDSAGSVASDVSDTHKMSWLDRMNEYGLPGSHANVGDKFGQWFYDEHPELFHLSLDVLGLVPVVGEYFDGMNAGLYASEGDYGNAALSGSSAVPIAGWIPAVGKIGRKTFKFLTKGAEKCNSFEPGTRVEMADGSEKPIEDVKLGDWVAATDPLTGETSPQRVVATIVGIGAKRLVDIETVESKLFAPSFKSRIVATEGHPFYVESRNRWVDAIDLTPGDVLRDNQSDVTVTVASARARTAPATVHNLTIDNLHTYYVLAGQTPVLAHNSGGCLPALRGWSSERFQFGNQSFLLEKKGLEHILTRHHPKYSDGSVKKTQSFFGSSMSVDDVQGAIGQVMRQNRDTLIQRGSRGMYQIRGNVNGVDYVLGINRGRVGQFYPE